MKILLVEDSRTQAAATIKDIKQINDAIKVEHATTIKEAQQQLLLQKFDMIVLDVTLPDGSGLDICSFIKNNEITRQTPVVLFSAERLIDLRKEAYAAGADYCVTKGDTGGMTLNLLVNTIFRRNGRSVA